MKINNKIDDEQGIRSLCISSLIFSERFDLIVKLECTSCQYAYIYTDMYYPTK